MKSGVSRWYKPWHPFIFVGPLIVGLFLFRLGPMIYAFFLSFNRWNIISAPVWVGLDNYVELFTSDRFLSILGNTLRYSVTYVPLVMIVGLGLALIINRQIKGIAFFRAAFFSPVITSAVAIGLIWSWILAPRFGILSYISRTLFGINTPAFLAQSATALTTVAVVTVWRMSGYIMIIYLAGLQEIPNTFYEASKLDGANAWQRLRYITLPLLTPTTFFILIISIFESFKNFEIIYTMTRGGPGISSTTISYSIYQNAFVFYRMGFGSAQAYVLLGIVSIVTVLNFMLKKRWVKYQY